MKATCIAILDNGDKVFEVPFAGIGTADGGAGDDGRAATLDRDDFATRDYNRWLRRIKYDALPPIRPAVEVTPFFDPFD